MFAPITHQYQPGVGAGAWLATGSILGADTAPMGGANGPTLENGFGPDRFAPVYAKQIHITPDPANQL